MPGRVDAEAQPRKRKRDDGTVKTKKADKPRKAVKITGGDDVEACISRYESTLLATTSDYNDLDALFALVRNASSEPRHAILAAVSLCRIFCAYIAGERLVTHSSLTELEREATSTLKRHVRTYAQDLCAWIGSPDATLENTAVTLLMRLVKEEVSQPAKRADQAWRTPTSTFITLVKTLLTEVDAAGARELFVEKHVEEHDDVRHFTFLAIKQLLREETMPEVAIANALDIMLQIEGVPTSKDELEDWLGYTPDTAKHPLLSLAIHQKAAQEAWLAVFKSQLSEAQRHKILEAMTEQILPWFATKLEILTDFLTDSFNASSGVALLALGGLFSLMTQRNIDYPDFYTKLYSLLDDKVLHSKHRNRFFRLLDQCLASSHLPAAMIASFLKRLSRHALQAPPGAIVWLIPFTYNMLRQHPACTFMIHRAPHPAHHIYAVNPDYAEAGMGDPFDMQQPDPMLTRAIDSSLWELDTLKTHYHPNVATLAGILGEQFTKREYQMEDFLDHTYNTLLDAELGKDLKKAPVVEYEIPKHIITAETADGLLNPLGESLRAAIIAM